MKSVINKHEISFILKEEITNPTYPDFLSDKEVKCVKNFHLSMDEYKVTPLVSLNTLAKKLGVHKIYVKDESYRFGLNAFKALGGTYAIARFLCKKLNIDVKLASFDYFNTPEVKEKIKDMVFATATDGNHGKGVAWAASKLGCKSVVYMPKGSSLTRLKAIQEVGAQAFITNLNYDESVRLVKEKAEKNGWQVIQDTSWEGYEDIPLWITQGYATMADEALEQMHLDGVKRPTHVFLQAGVGASAGSILGYYANVFKDECPIAVIVEPEDAACIYKSALADDGKAHFVTGELNTIMAGLACGEPNPMTWEILRDFAKGYVSCPDYVTARGMRILGNPIGKDEKIISGESGAVGLGLLTLLLEREELKDVKEKLKIDEHSIILCFSTEGDTDPQRYAEIVHDGKYPSTSL